mmetsp:Transcript_3060/g.4559  ORF Transcript_3060/g.4559 Transcript_3060/m.4559 type:complete len:253 (-) Transcript_3060:1030-1788(-)
MDSVAAKIRTTFCPTNFGLMIVPMDVNSIPPKTELTDPMSFVSKRATIKPAKKAPISNESPRDFVSTADARENVTFSKTVSCGLSKALEMPSLRAIPTENFSSSITIAITHPRALMAARQDLRIPSPASLTITESDIDISPSDVTASNLTTSEAELPKGCLGIGILLDFAFSFASVVDLSITLTCRSRFELSPPPQDIAIERDEDPIAIATIKLSNAECVRLVISKTIHAKMAVMPILAEVRATAFPISFAI